MSLLAYATSKRRCPRLACGAPAPRGCKVAIQQPLRWSARRTKSGFLISLRHQHGHAITRWDEHCCTVRRCGQRTQDLQVLDGRTREFEMRRWGAKRNAKRAVLLSWSRNSCGSSTCISKTVEWWRSLLSRNSKERHLPALPTLAMRYRWLLAKYNWHAGSHIPPTWSWRPCGEHRWPLA